MMREIEQLNRLLDEVGKRDAIELKLNHEGTGGLELKSRIKLFFEYVKSKDRLYIYTPLMTIPPDDPRRILLYEAMLDCNFLNLGCETGALAIYRYTGQAVYQTGLDVKNMTADRLDKALEELIDQRDEVVYQLEQAKTASAKPARSPSHGAGASTFSRLVMQLPR